MHSYGFLSATTSSRFISPNIPSWTPAFSIFQDPNVNGILVQLPLPGHLDEQAIIERIAQHKDVDGLHPLNVAQLANTKTHAPGRAAWSFDSIGFHVSCTPQVINWSLPSIINDDSHDMLSIMPQPLSIDWECTVTFTAFTWYYLLSVWIWMWNDFSIYFRINRDASSSLTAVA